MRMQGEKQRQMKQILVCSLVIVVGSSVCASNFTM
jgi:hypothetical protein